MKNRKFTKLDLLVVCVVLIAVLALSAKFTKAAVSAPTADRTKLLLSFYIEETPTFGVDAIEIGAPVKEQIQNSNFGKVISLDKKAAIYWESDDDGNLVAGSKEGYNSLTLSMEATGTINELGITIDKSLYFVGQTVSLYAGNTYLKDGRISKVEYAD